MSASSFYMLISTKEQPASVFVLYGVYTVCMHVPLNVKNLQIENSDGGKTRLKKDIYCKYLN